MNGSVTSRDYVIWGSAGHAKVLASAITLLGGKVVALFDNRQVPSALADVPVFIGEEGFAAWLDGRVAHSLSALVAVGGHHGRDRVAIQRRLRAAGLHVDPLVHPDASLCSTARVGSGTQILAQSVVAADVVLGEGCIVNHRASVDHESRLGDGVHVAPGAIICGCVEIGTNVMIGAGAVVLPRIKVGDDALIGAGAIVTKDVSPASVIVGNPGRPHVSR